MEYACLRTSIELRRTFVVIVRESMGDLFSLFTRSWENDRITYYDSMVQTLQSQLGALELVGVERL